MRLPSFLFGITAWWVDGEGQKLSWDDLVVFDTEGNEKAWITDEQATALAVTIFIIISSAFILWIEQYGVPAESE